jgi:hypothetical protein
MAEKRVTHRFDYPAPGVKDPGGNDVPGSMPDGGQQLKPRWGRVPDIVRSFIQSLTGDQRPTGGWDREGPTFGSPLDMLGGPYGPVPYYGDVTWRDTWSHPVEVILPVAALGYNAIPLETPRYFRGSFWLDDNYSQENWERGP